MLLALLSIKILCFCLTTLTINVKGRFTSLVPSARMKGALRGDNEWEVMNACVSINR